MTRRRIHAPDAGPSSAERVRMSRGRRAEEGWRHIYVSLPPDAADRLAVLVRQHGSIRAAIEAALLVAAQST